MSNSDPCEDALKGDRPSITEVSCAEHEALQECLQTDQLIPMWLEHLEKHGCGVSFKCYECEGDGPIGFWCLDTKTVYLCVNAEHLCCVIREELLHAMQSTCLPARLRIIRDIPLSLDCEDKFLQWLQDEGHGNLAHPTVADGVHRCIDCLVKELQAKFCSRCCHEGGPWHKPGVDPLDCVWDRAKTSCGECAQLLLNGQPFDIDLFRQFLESPEGADCKSLITSCERVPYPEEENGA